MYFCMDISRLVEPGSAFPSSFKIGGVELLNTPKPITQEEANIQVRITYYKPSSHSQNSCTAKPIFSHRVTLYPQDSDIRTFPCTPALGKRHPTYPTPALPVSPQPPTVYPENSELTQIFSSSHKTFKEQADEKWGQYAHKRRKKLNARKAIPITPENGIPKPQSPIQKIDIPYTRLPQPIGRMGNRKVFSYTPTNFSIN